MEETKKLKVYKDAGVLQKRIASISVNYTVDNVVKTDSISVFAKDNKTIKEAIVRGFKEDGDKEFLRLLKAKEDACSAFDTYVEDACKKDVSIQDNNRRIMRAVINSINGAKAADLVEAAKLLNVDTIDTDNRIGQRYQEVAKKYNDTVTVKKKRLSKEERKAERLAALEAARARAAALEAEISEIEAE